MRIRLKNGFGVTVKAEDRPSGSAGDSASVSTPFFRISVSVVVRGVCLSRRREAPALSYQDKHTPRLQIAFLRSILWYGKQVQNSFLLRHCVLIGELGSAFELSVRKWNVMFVWYGLFRRQIIFVVIENTKV